jgi:hypothetical protein
MGMPFLRRRKSVLIDGAGDDARDWNSFGRVFLYLLFGSLPPNAIIYTRLQGLCFPLRRASRMSLASLFRSCGFGSGRG